MSDELIERIALDLYSIGRHPDDTKWGHVGNHIREQMLSCARAAVAAIEASGTHRVVPVTTTDEMEQAVYALPPQSTQQLWLRMAYAAMLSAAPKLGGET